MVMFVNMYHIKTEAEILQAKKKIQDAGVNI